jgi:uncharacterized protein
MNVESLWRYPLKGARGEPLLRASVGEHGLDGDRVWVTRDPVTMSLITAKIAPGLRQIRVSHDGTGTELRFPDEARHRAGSDGANNALSHLLGRSVVLEALDRDAPISTFERRNEEASFRDVFGVEHGDEMPDFSIFSKDVRRQSLRFAARPQTYLDFGVVHIVTTSSLRWIEQHVAGAGDARRFRPNIVIDAGTSASRIEQEWLGSLLVVGQVQLRVVMPTIRCVMINQAADDMAAAPRLVRTLRQTANQLLGVYADVVVPGELFVGDTVSLG